MKHLLKSYKEPTTIYVLGCYFLETKETLSITDDYSTIDCIHNSDNTMKSFRDNGGNKCLSTTGYLFILDKTELEEVIGRVEHTSLNEDGFKLENFVGDIYVDLVNSKFESVLKKDFNLHSYIMYEYEDGDEPETSRLIFPEGSLSNVDTLRECGQLLEIENYDI